MKIVIVDQNKEEVITVEQAQLQCRSDDEEETTYFSELLIPAARKSTEKYLQRPLNKVSANATCDSFPRGRSAITIKGYGPAEITSVSYSSKGEVFQLPIEDLKVSSIPNGISITCNSDWPDGSDIEISFTAGYEIIPEDIRLAMLLQIAEMYRNRETSSSTAQLGAYGFLLEPYVYGYGL